ncbi:winged helix DNA-binding domain-containing protein [Hamadaea sp.]|uniref:winged helix DNA-binding domain-containing protein n=1 Tax=Hamadaea sp. TaxID=2024425 RepID=UPI0025C5AC74|nr:winged helix DNA-binding domain-containing protein [Hamadaea sp.]
MLSLRDLNRATLDRQLLLRRSSLSVVEAVTHLCGLQAQTTHSWYAGLWGRLAKFDPQQVVTLMADRALVRIAVQRSTIHLVTAADALTMRPLVQSVGERSFASNWAKFLPGVELAEVVTAGVKLLEQQPMTFSDLGKRLTEVWPDRDGPAMAQAVRTFAALVQPPPRGLWGRSGLAVHVPAEQYLGRPLAVDPSIDELIVRYLTAFGPASVQDAQTWSGLTRLGEVFERLRPRLIAYADEQGRELFDVPEGPRPEADVEAPVRFLYDFDNLLLSHADRTRVLDPAYRPLLWPQSNTALGSVLVDGFVRASWRPEKSKGKAHLTVISYQPFPTRQRSAVEAEGRRLLEFLVPGAEHDVRFTTAG